MEVKHICKNVHVSCRSLCTMSEHRGPVLELEVRLLGFSVRQVQLSDLSEVQKLLTLNYFIFKMFVLVMTGRVAKRRNLWWEVYGKVHVNCLPWVLAQRKQMKHRSVVCIRDRLQAQWIARRTYKTQDIVIFMAKFITEKKYRARWAKEEGARGEIWGKPGIDLTSGVAQDVNNSSSYELWYMWNVAKQESTLETACH